ncbi:hypothetical protein NE237_004702 [Protea cynaroides]|uniref:Phytosulfokine n=1 Tax=Protea cynaroides TaxID=273540 RepID=A0A9Q0KJ62_9MAGN|nr:hypothetical protein NE237_004702 [Protea cynaroides]
MMFNQCPKYGMTSACGRRRDMEDAVVIHPSFCQRDSLFPLGLHFFGVYDGHGCSRPDRPDELNRIQEAGGRVIYWDGARVLGVLAMSRTIGDSYLKPYVVSEPEVTITERTEEDECLILASDGLWDVVSNDIAYSIARMCIDGQAPSPPPSPRSSSRSSGGDDDMNVGVASETSDKSCIKKSTARLILAKQDEEKVKVDKIVQGGPLRTEGVDDSWNQLMGMEDCGDGDEECLKRRMVAEAHLDYIYTQHHKP